MDRSPGKAMTTGSGPNDEGGAAPATVLLVETSASAAGRIEKALLSAGMGEFRVEWVTRVPEAVERLGRGDVDIVLVGLDEPDRDPMDAFDRIRRATPDALILPLNGAAPEGAGPAACDDGHDAPGTARQTEAHWLPDALRYVTQRKNAEAALHAAEEILFEEKERAQVTLNSIGDAVLVTDLQGNVTYVNPVAEVLTGWTNPVAAGRPLADVFDIIDGGTREPAENPALQAIREDRAVGLAANCVLRRPDGGESGIEDSAAPIHDRHGRVSGAVIVFRDVSLSRAMTHKMAYLAHHDALTDLPNRVLLAERLDQAIRLAHRHGRKLALLFVDLDDFKAINDSLGHVVGDHVLQAVAETLTACVRASDTVCRQGGDEFVILLAEIQTTAGAIRPAEKVLERLSEPLVVDEHVVSVRASIGVSVYPDDGDDTETLLRHADAAMYKARDDASAPQDIHPPPGNRRPAVQPAGERRADRLFEQE